MAVVMALGGCYRFVPAGPVDPVPGARVRLHLTQAGTTQLSGYLGPRIALVDGAVIAMTDSAYLVAITGVTTETGEEQFWESERATLSRAAVARVERRQLDRVRTALAAASLAGTVAGAISVADGIGGGSPPGGGRPGPR